MIKTIEATKSQRNKPLSNKLLAWSWWAGFLVLIIAVVLLSLCTFFKVENKELVEIWKSIVFASLGYVLGIPARMLSSNNIE